MRLLSPSKAQPSLAALAACRAVFPAAQRRLLWPLLEGGLLAALTKIPNVLLAGLVAFGAYEIETDPEVAKRAGEQFKRARQDGDKKSWAEIFSQLWRAPDQRPPVETPHSQTPVAPPSSASRRGPTRLLSLAARRRLQHQLLRHWRHIVHRRGSRQRGRPRDTPRTGARRATGAPRTGTAPSGRHRDAQTARGRSPRSALRSAACNARYRDVR